MTLQPWGRSECIYSSDQSGRGITLLAGEKETFDIDTDRNVGIDPSSFYVHGTGTLVVAVLVEE